MGLAGEGGPWRDAHPLVTHRAANLLLERPCIADAGIGERTIQQLVAGVVLDAQCQVGKLGREKETGNRLVPVKSGSF
ncbi:hypothetical protein D9M68_885210 [compost metagenome]